MKNNPTLKLHMWFLLL